MRTIQPILIIILSIIILGSSSCNFNCVDPQGPIITDTRVLESFDGIHIEIPANAKLIVGGEPGIAITAPESYVRAITTNIRRGVLQIVGDVCKADARDIVIEITVPSLDEIKISGSASVFSDTPVKSDDLELNISGSGSISLSVFTNSIDAEINGSGSILLNGTCQDLDLGINGSGGFKGLGLNSFKAIVKINGSGNASVVAHNKLHAKVNGSGDIGYSGDPEVNISISGSGKVNKIN